jgi:Bacterial dnaA protein helix-turn-helix
MTKAKGYLRIAEDDGARFRPESEFNAGRICSVTVIAFPCPTAADVREHAAHVRAVRAQVFRPQVVCVPVLGPHRSSESQSPGPSLPVPSAIAEPPSSEPHLPGPSTPDVPVIAEPSAGVPGRISVRRVLEVTADHFATSVSDLVSGCRKQPLCRHRQVAMFVARRVTGRSLPFIAHNMGGRDHTTILHGVRAIKGLLDAGDGEIIGAVHQIIERLRIAGGAHD